MTRTVTLVTDLMEAEGPGASFLDALHEVDSLTLSPSLLLRDRLSKVAAAHPKLLQRNFQRHAAGERATSETLMCVAGTLKPIALREEMRAHSRDELRHAKLFHALSDQLQTVTGTVDRGDYEWILENDRRFIRRYNGDVIEFICDVFAAEVRTYSFVTSYVSSLREGEPICDRRIVTVLEKILDDELRHIGYTAKYINRWMAAGLNLRSSLQRSFSAFDRNSWIEVAETARYFYER